MFRVRSRSRSPASAGKQTSLCISDTNYVEFDVPAQVGDSIKTVKGYIKDKINIPEDQQELWWKGHQLTDDRVLTDICITLDLNVIVYLTVRQVSGREVTVKTEANECVGAVIQTIHDQLKIPRCQQKLVFDTTVLTPRRTWSEYGITTQSVVTLVTAACKNLPDQNCSCRVRMKKSSDQCAGV